VRGVVFSLSRADGVVAAGRVRVSLDYSGFADAYGADFGARLRMVALPGCALTTPSLPDCQARTDVGSVNRAGSLSAGVTVGGDVTPSGAPVLPGVSAGRGPATVFAAASVPSSAGGTFTQTSLSPAYSWAAGNQSGDYSYRYPFRVPPGLGGPVPDLSLDYRS